MNSMNIESQYLDTIYRIVHQGKLKPNRTGTPAFSIPPVALQHDMSNGFPLLTTKKVALRLIAVETEMYLKGNTSKKWLQERNCHIWDQWCNPKKVPYGNDVATQKKMLEEDDLGPIYGAQWRNFNGSGIDQLKNVIEGLKKDPYNRRLVVSTWNPQQIDQMALPPCHVAFHVNCVEEGKLNLTWWQRSCDMMLGVPFNIASYALILTLLAKEVKMEPSILTGFLCDVHIYQNHIDGAKVQVDRTPKKCPKLEITDFTSIFNWKCTDYKLSDYDPDPEIKLPIAV
jgi:thymidylate synthase